MDRTFAELVRSFIQRRNLSVEQLATRSNLSRKTLYRWVKGEVVHPRHWYQIVAVGNALRLSVDEVDQLLWVTRYPSFQELKDFARYEYELELLEEFTASAAASLVAMKSESGLIPRPKAHIEPWAALEAPVGAVRPESPFYIERAADGQLRHQIAEQGTTTTIQAGRQTGKTSLLVQAIHATRHEQQKIIYLDFQLADESSQDDLTSFLRFLSEMIAEQLDLDGDVVDGYWQAVRNPAQTFNRFLQREVLERLDQDILLAIDEADALLDAEYKKHFFALLRAWDSRRAFDANWRKLNLVLVISTHPFLLIDDVNLSPFNVGLNIQLKDFTREQVAELNQRHGSPLKPDQIPLLMTLVGGHPYLVRQAFYTLVSEGLSLGELSAVASSSEGPFGKHLLFYQHSLKKNPGLLAALQQVLRERKLPDETRLERLTAVGLLQYKGGKWKPRCGVYEEFFMQQIL